MRQAAPASRSEPTFRSSETPAMFHDMFVACAASSLNSVLAECRADFGQGLGHTSFLKMVGTEIFSRQWAHRRLGILPAL